MLQQSINKTIIGLVAALSCACYTPKIRPPETGFCYQGYCAEYGIRKTRLFLGAAVHDGSCADLGISVDVNGIHEITTLNPSVGIQCIEPLFDIRSEYGCVRFDYRILFGEQCRSLKQ